MSKFAVTYVDRNEDHTFTIYLKGSVSDVREYLYNVLSGHGNDLIDRYVDEDSDHASQQRNRAFSILGVADSIRSNAILPERLETNAVTIDHESWSYQKA